MRRRKFKKRKRKIEKRNNVSVFRCSRKFGKRVLVAMREDRVEEMKERKRRRTCVVGSVWQERVNEALFLQSNTRTVPGKASVSVAYGQRRPKILLLRSKRDIAQEIRQAHMAEGPPCLSTILTLFPANFVRPTERDREANACVRHSNLWQLVKGLKGYLPSLPSSSRELAAMVMCPPSATKVYSVLEPLTWVEACALR